jgi:DNA-binding MarR family transcriptional regulator
LLEGLSAHALKFRAESFEVTREDSFQRAWARIDGQRTRILNFKYTDPDSRELRQNLAAALARPVLTVLHGRRVLLRVRCIETDAYEVTIEPVPPLDASAPPKFTAKQGQYLAFIHYYSKVHRQAPAESDLQRYFRVSPPSIHEMIKTLERNGLIERTPGQARSIRLLVRPEHLPVLE